MRRPRGGGFTLIELLVVISIIALLVGILLPALGKAKASAIDAKCMAGMKQIGLAVFTYTSDFKQNMVPFDNLIDNGIAPTGVNLYTGGPTDTDVLWTDTLVYQKYVTAPMWNGALPPSESGDMNELVNVHPGNSLFTCPANASGPYLPTLRARVGTQYYFTSLGGVFQNGAAATYPVADSWNPVIGYVGPRRIDRVVRPSEFIMSAEAGLTYRPSPIDGNIYPDFSQGAAMWWESGLRPRNGSALFSRNWGTQNNTGSVIHLATSMTYSYDVPTTAHDGNSKVIHLDGAVAKTPQEVTDLATVSPMEDLSHYTAVYDPESAAREAARNFHPDPDSTDALAWGGPY